MATVNQPYSASTIGRHGDNKDYVDGPGDGFGYYASRLWPWTGFSSQDDAKAAAFLCNEAFKQGYQSALQEVRKSLGIA